MKAAFSVLFAILHIANICSAQMTIRYGANFQRYIPLETHTFSGFNSVGLIRGIGNWTSPSINININGLPYESFPFNLSSVDLIPADLINNSLLEISNNYDLNTLSGYGTININAKQISDSILYSFRAFTGSETGDPLIYTFTSDQVELVNKNKIVPSFALSVENSPGKFSYRFSGGYFGYFATNSFNTASFLSALGSEVFKKQNKQAFGAAEIFYNLPREKRIILDASLITFYGWDTPPFTNSFTHLEQYSYRVRLSAENLIDNLIINAVNNGSVSMVKDFPLIPGVNLLLNDYQISSEYLVDLSSSKIKSKINYNLYSGKDFELKKNISRQQFFTQKHTKAAFSAAIEYSISFSHNASADIFLKYDNHFVNRNSFSSGLSVQFEMGKSKLSASLSSIARFPNLSELYGNFFVIRNIDSLISPLSFNISGNRNLKEEVVRSAGICFEHSNTSFRLQINLFYKAIRNPIGQKILAIFKSQYPSDYIRNAIYDNLDYKSYIGVETRLKQTLLKNTETSIEHLYVYCRQNDPAGKNRLILDFNYYLPFNSTIGVSYFFQNKSSLEEFRIDKVEESIHKIPEISSFKFQFIQNIRQFYFINNLSVGLLVENLFNKKIKYLPFGNYLDRTILLHLELNI